MLKEERQKAILYEVELHNRILLSDVAEQLNVSIDTARRDVKELDAENKLRKVHGGAVSLGFANYSLERNKVYALEEKRAIAQKALSLIKEDHVILIDGGTTCLELARLIPSDLGITCFTLSLPVAMELLNKPGVRTIFIGGVLSKDSQICIGANAIHNLAQVRVDYGFIGTGYVDASFGLTELDWDIVQTKKAVIRASKKAILLSISEKLNSQHRFKTCSIDEIDTLITELEPHHGILDPFKEADINII